MGPDYSHTQPGRSLTSRGYQTERDLQQMQALLMEARSCTDDWRYWHVGELTFAFLMVACHLNPQEHIRLWHNAEGKLVGYAILGEDPSVDWQVLPDYEWTGIETEALTWVDMRLSELRQSDAQAMGRSSDLRRPAGQRQTHCVSGGEWLPARRVCGG